MRTIVTILLPVLGLLAKGAIGQEVFDPRQPRRERVVLPADTIPADARPSTEFRRGAQELWFTDWDLLADRAPLEPVEERSIPRGQVSFLALFDENGWLREVRHMDARKRILWSRVFIYEPRRGLVVPLREVRMSDGEGQALDQSALQRAVRDNALTFTSGTRDRDIHMRLGEPLVRFESTGGSSEWRYLLPDREIRYRFDRRNRLTGQEVRLASEVPPPPAIVSIPSTPASGAAVSSAKPSPLPLVPATPAEAAAAGPTVPDTSPRETGTASEQDLPADLPAAPTPPPEF